jgi:zinc/manganese transport system substrate-binding protein
VVIGNACNAKIQPAQSGYMDMSQFCNILEIPQGQVTRAMGDVHPLGNPHYWLNPDNGRRRSASRSARRCAHAAPSAARLRRHVRSQLGS